MQVAFNTCHSCPRVRPAAFFSFLLVAWLKVKYTTIKSFPLSHRGSNFAFLVCSLLRTPASLLKIVISLQHQLRPREILQGLTIAIFSLNACPHSFSLPVWDVRSASPTSEFCQPRSCNGRCAGSLRRSFVEANRTLFLPSNEFLDLTKSCTCTLRFFDFELLSIINSYRV